MAAINFPSSPSNGDTHVVDGVTYTYNSAETKWKTTINSNAFLALTGGNVTGNLSVDTDTLFVDASTDRVGINTTSPSAFLHVQNGEIVKDQDSSQNSANPGFQIKHNGTINGSWRHDGRLEIGGQDANADVRLDTEGIKFNGDTAAANALDDYEEGTWTPTIDIGGSTTGITYAQQKGIYTKIGDVLVVGCWIELSSKGTATGAVRIDGLPFAANIPGGPVNAGVLVNETWTSSWPQTTTYGLTWSDGYVYLRYNNTTSWAAIGDSNLTNTTQIYWSNTFKIS